MSPRTENRPGSRACSSWPSTSCWAWSSSSCDGGRTVARASELVLVRIGLELFLFLELVLVGVLAGGRARAARLEGLDELVALVLVDRGIVAEEDPLCGLVLL